MVHTVSVVFRKAGTSIRINVDQNPCAKHARRWIAKNFGRRWGHTKRVFLDRKGIQDREAYYISYSASVTRP